MTDRSPPAADAVPAVTTPGAQSLVGHVLAGRYRIVSKLGEGAMGDVYLGEHLRIARRDAIKVLRPSLAEDREAIARFMRGARNVAAIRNANVCTIYDFSDTAEGIRFLAMEYIEGETLKDTLDREGRLSVERTVDIACQVAGALQAAHDAGVIHRDLKPGNIMLCRRGPSDVRERIKVVDFDISKGAGDPGGEEVTRTGFVVGTPEYMSPEQLIGEPLDGRSDLYSLGVVVFRMLTGRLPFRATNMQDMMLERLTSAPMPLREALGGAAPLSPELAAIEAELDRALARKPEDRQSDCAEFARALMSIAAPAGVAAIAGIAGISTPTTPMPMPVPPPPRRPEITPTREAMAVSSPPPRAAPVGRRRRLALIAGVAVLAAIGVFELARFSGHAASGDTTRPDVAQRDTGHSTTGLVGRAADRASPAAGQAPAIDSSSIPSARRPIDATSKADHAPPVHPPVRPTTSSSLTGVALAAMLDRQLETVSGSMTPALLQAVRDSAQLALHSATVRRDSATAFLVLAQAALVNGDTAECASWARAGQRLGAAGFATLLRACR